MNKIKLKGSIVRDAYVNGNITKFTIAVRDGDDTDFIDCTAFGNNLEHKKGDLIAIEGSMHNKNYTNKKNKRVYGIEIHVKKQFVIKKAQKTQPDNEITDAQILDALSKIIDDDEYSRKAV